MFRKKNDNQADGLSLTPDAEVTIVGWRRMESELQAPASRRLNLAVILSLVATLAWTVLSGGGSASAWGSAVIGALAWAAVIRFMLIDIRWLQFWPIWLAIGFAAPLYAGSGETGRAIGLGVSLLFLVLRRYRPFHHIGSRRRAFAFASGFLILILLALVDPPAVTEESTGAMRLGAAFAWISLWSLRFFWFLVLVRLFFGMRLHFLRLRPKLAVSGLFIALVPALLVIAMAIISSYGVLGGGRATTGRQILLEWSQRMEAGDTDFAGDGEGFVWRREKGAVVAGPATPDWMNIFAAAIDAAGPVSATFASADTVTAVTLRTASFPADTTAYFVIGGEVWLMQLRGSDSPDIEVRGLPIDEDDMTRMAHLLRADVGLFSSANFNFGNSRGDVPELNLDLRGRYTEAVPDSVSVPFLQRPLGFGGSMVEVLRLVDGRFEPGTVLLHLSVCPDDLAREFLRGDVNEFNNVVLVGLAVVAGLFLAVVALALFFGVRITNGITSAVQGLQRATRRLAAGDLSVYIDIPNEDELGDLALSFNDMTAAIQRGREEAVERERLERELSTAREIQQHLLPHDFPEVPGFEVTGVSVPSLQVGGDYFDFLDQGNGRTGVAIGDVSGKGMPAALLMANLQASLQGQVIHPNSVSDIVSCVNDLLVHSTDTHMFATFFYGVIDRGAATFTCTNAGHNPPLLVRADGQVEQLGVGGLLLGMLPGRSYEQQTVDLDPGDVLVLYTDGITEAVGPDLIGEGDSGERALEDEIDADSMFGEERLLDVVRAGAGLSAVALRESILRAVNDFTAGVAQSDDITLVVIRRLP